MPAPYVSLAFVRYPDPKLNTFASRVYDGMTGNVAFPAPAVDLGVLETARVAFSDAHVAAMRGGKAATTAKGMARVALIALLRRQAGYVENNCNGSIAILLSSGFELRPVAGASRPLETPVILWVKNTASTKLTMRVKAPANFKSIEVRMRTGSGPWQSGGVFTRPIRMVLTDLVPGTLYEIQVRAVGGSTGYSEWSHTVTQMST
jgi:hypothetical protein